MNDGVVTHGNALADGDEAIVVGVRHGVVLHVTVATDGAGINLGAHGGAKPYGSVFGQVDVAGKRCAVGDE